MTPGSPIGAERLSHGRAHRRFRYVSVLVAVCTGAVLPGSGSVVQGGGGSEPFDHASYDRLLRAYVDDDGLVDYRGLGAVRAVLDRYLTRIGSAEPGVFNGWESDARKAFLVNAYNAYTIQAVLDSYPIQRRGLISLYPKNSIRQIPGVWDRAVHRVAGTDLTLDQIEHERLRRDYDDPRIHYALVCAAMGCPPLRPVAYTASNIDSLLDAAGRRFLQQPENNRLDRRKGVLYLCRIFDWYGEDFMVTGSDEPAYPFLSHKEAAVVRGLFPLMPEAWRLWIGAADRFKVSWTRYDWTLNEQPLPTAPDG